MEINAAWEAVKTLGGPLEIVSDSTYVVNCFRDRWWEGWLARGWRNSQKQPVANRDLWEPLIDAVRAEPDRVAFRWVKGHGTDMVNDLVDRLAVEAARTQSGRTGTGTPSTLGPADLPGSQPVGGRARVADAACPAGHRLVVGGHRPPALGGYDPNPTGERIVRRLREVLAAKRELHPDLVVLTGLGLGAEQMGAEAAAAARVGYVAVLAFPEPDSVWPQATRARFRTLRSGAADEVLLQRARPTSAALAAAALRRRDAWLARNADEAIVVWDGEDAAVGRLVRSLKDAVGEDDVWVMEPAE